MLEDQDWRQSGCDFQISFDNMALRFVELHNGSDTPSWTMGAIGCTAALQCAESMFRPTSR